MQILRLIIGVTALILCVFISKRYANKQKDKVNYYNSLLTMLSSVNSELEYRKRSIKETVDIEYLSSDFAKTIYSVYFASDKAFFPKYLTSYEVEKLKILFESLGTSNLSSQKIMITAYISEYEKIASKLSENNTKNASVIQKIGFFIGLMLLIMVV